MMNDIYFALRSGSGAHFVIEIKELNKAPLWIHWVVMMLNDLGFEFAPLQPVFEISSTYLIS